MVARVVRDDKVAGSSPVIPTNFIFKFFLNFSSKIFLKKFCEKIFQKNFKKFLREKIFINF